MHAHGLEQATYPRTAQRIPAVPPPYPTSAQCALGFLKEHAMVLGERQRIAAGQPIGGGLGEVQGCIAGGGRNGGRHEVHSCLQLPQPAPLHSPQPPPSSLCLLFLVPKSGAWAGGWASGMGSRAGSSGRAAAHSLTAPLPGPWCSYVCTPRTRGKCLGQDCRAASCEAGAAVGQAQRCRLMDPESLPRPRGRSRPQQRLLTCLARLTAWMAGHPSPGPPLGGPGRGTAPG